jgi:hypothetical protein
MQPLPKPRTQGGRFTKAANDNNSSRRVVIQLPANAPVTITEIEVFDLLIGAATCFAANDNERYDPHSDAIRAPPSMPSVPTMFILNKEKNATAIQNDPRPENNSTCGDLQPRFHFTAAIE